MNTIQKLSHKNDVLFSLLELDKKFGAHITKIVNLNMSLI